MSEPIYRVRCKEKIYYIDGIREPGQKDRAGNPMDEFALRSKKDFNPQFMEPLGWIPELTEKDKVSILEATKEDGTHRTAEEITMIKSDRLDEEVRQKRAKKASKENEEFEKPVKAKEVL